MHYRSQDFQERKKTIKIKGNQFSHCEGCILIKGMKKVGGFLDDLDIQILENNFDVVSRCCLSLENVNAGRILIKKNILVTCNSTAFRVLNCKSSKDDIMIVDNSLSGVYNTALHVDSSVVQIKDNTFLSSTCAVYIYLIPSS